jgi:hypothetical protein
VADAERLDPALLPQREGDEEAKLDELGLAEVPVQRLPQRIIGEICIPDDGPRPTQRGLLAIVELLGALEL